MDGTYASKDLVYQLYYDAKKAAAAGGLNPDGSENGATSQAQNFVNGILINSVDTLATFIKKDGTVAFTGSQSLGGFNLTAIGRTFGANGAVGTPSYSFTNSTDMGLYRVSATQMGFSIGGVLKALVDSNGLMTSQITEQVIAGGLLIDGTGTISIGDCLGGGNSSVISIDDAAQTITVSATNVVVAGLLSTDGGTSRYTWAAASATAPLVQDTKIRVTINGTNYDIAATAA